MKSTEHSQGDPDGLAGLARQALDRREWVRAQACYQELLELEPANVAARYGFATARLEQGAAEEAEEIFDHLIRRGDRRPQLRFMRGRSRLQCARLAEALDDLRAGYLGDPSPITLRGWAGAVWMAGDGAAFERILREAAARPPLVAAAADLLRQAGAPAQAITVVEQAARRGSLSVDGLACVATAYVDLDEAASAERVALTCLSHAPGQEVAMAAILSACLMLQRPQDALQAVAPSRRAQPDRQHWIAYEATALRMLGDERYRRLVDIDRFVRPFELPVPPGYESLQAFNEALCAALDRWHVFTREPLGQTLRGGIQTPRDLRGLPDPAVQAYLKALEGPVREYLDSLGDSPDSPLTARNGHGWQFSGAFSVKLFGGGYHVDHVHPAGWISSAYYVRVPPAAGSGDPMAGCIHFARPPFECGLGAEHHVQPRAGRLVLFPSYLWHGTTPTAPDDGIRVTAPFDVVPADAAPGPAMPSTG